MAGISGAAAGTDTRGVVFMGFPIHRSFTIYPEIKKKFGINADQYQVLESIRHLSTHNPNYKWCMQKKDEIAEYCAISRSTVFRVIAKGKQQGLIESSPENEEWIRTTNLWNQYHKKPQTSLQTMPYSEYLKTPEWQERRIKHLKKSDYRCQLCNMKSVTLNVHHRTYERRGHERDEDLIVLCQECHEIFHKEGKLVA